MKEFIAERMPYDALQEKVLENEAAIQDMKDNPSSGGSGGGASVSNTASKDAMVIAKANSSDVTTFVNTGQYSVVPVFPGSNSNATEVQAYITSNGVGGRIVERTQAGHKVDDKEIPQGNINLPPHGSIPSEGDFAASVNKVKELLALKKEATIKGRELEKGVILSGAMGETEYGLLFISGEDITVSYTGNGTAQSIKANTHFIIKAHMSDGSNRMIHIYTTSMINGYIKSIDSLLSSSVDVKNGSSTYGCRVISMPMKSVY